MVDDPALEPSKVSAPLRARAARALAPIAGLVLALFLADWVLALNGVPGRRPVRAGHPPDLDTQVTFLEFSHRFRTNDLGLRDESIPLEPRTDERRVLLLGDSFTEGLGVEEPDCFASLLEARAAKNGRPVEFLNGGIRATGPVQQGRFLVSIGLRYAPRIALLCVYANDVYEVPPDADAADIRPAPPRFGGVRGFVYRFWPRLHNTTAHLWDRRSSRASEPSSGYLDGVRAEARRRSIPEERVEAWCGSVPEFLLQAVADGKFNGTVLGSGLIVPDYWRQCLDLEGADAARKWTAMTSVLAAIREECAARGMRLGLVYLPAAIQYDEAFFDPENPLVRLGPERRREWLEEPAAFPLRLAEWCAQRDVPFRDLTEDFRSERASLDPAETMNWPLDGHWTAAGHRVAAEAIGSWLDQEPRLAGLLR